MCKAEACAECDARNNALSGALPAGGQALYVEAGEGNSNMQRFSCPACGGEVHFDNTACIACGNLLGYAPWAGHMLTVPANAAAWQDGGQRCSPCANRAPIGCNWLLSDTDSNICRSCRQTVMIPNQSAGENRDRWAKLESAKRNLLYSLYKFHLPVTESGAGAPPSLRFEFKADVLAWDGSGERVTTGHDNGVITINIAEADDALREEHRVSMGEPYRTLIGHFRHEVGHYYWDRLIAGSQNLAAFRPLFGDERDNYSQALGRHYQMGPPPNWAQSFVSAYAASHPWEDFAETWAHYFHIVDGLETAQAYGLDVSAKAEGGPYGETNFKALIDAWIPLTVAMNAVNRSIGNSDFYPFVLSGTIFGKLAFVHGLIHGEQ